MASSSTTTPGTGEELSSARPPMPSATEMGGVPVSHHYVLGLHLYQGRQHQRVYILLRALFRAWGIPQELVARIATARAQPLMYCVHRFILCPSCGGVICCKCCATSGHHRPCVCVVRMHRRSERARIQAGRRRWNTYGYASLADS